MPKEGRIERDLREVIQELLNRAEQHEEGADHGDDQGHHVGITTFGHGVAAGLRSAAERVQELLDEARARVVRT